MYKRTALGLGFGDDGILSVLYTLHEQSLPGKGNKIRAGENHLTYLNLCILVYKHRLSPGVLSRLSFVLSSLLEYPIDQNTNTTLQPQCLTQ